MSSSSYQFQAPSLSSSFPITMLQTPHQVDLMTTYNEPSFTQSVPLSPLIITPQMLKLVSDYFRRTHPRFIFYISVNHNSVIFTELVQLTKATEHKFIHELALPNSGKASNMNHLPRHTAQKAWHSHSTVLIFSCINLVFIKGMKLVAGLTAFSCSLPWVPVSELETHLQCKEQRIIPPPPPTPGSNF